MWGVLIWQASFSQAVWLQSSWPFLSHPGTHYLLTTATLSESFGNWIKRCWNYKFQSLKSRLNQKSSLSFHFSGSNTTPQLVFRPGQRWLVWSEGHFSDWPLPSVSGGPSGRGFQIDRRVLVSSLPLPPGWSHHPQRAVRRPGPERFGEDGGQSQQPGHSQSGGWSKVRHGEWHQDGNAGGRLKGGGGFGQGNEWNRIRGVLICKQIL